MVDRRWVMGMVDDRCPRRVLSGCSCQDAKMYLMYNVSYRWKQMVASGISLRDVASSEETPLAFPQRREPHPIVAERNIYHVCRYKITSISIMQCVPFVCIDSRLYGLCSSRV